MNKHTISIFAVILAMTSSLASAEVCNPGSGEKAVRVKFDTIGAINQATYKVLDSLLASESLSALKTKNSEDLRRLYAEHLVEPVAAGRVVCTDSLTGRGEHAKHVRLESEGFSVWVREKDVAVID
jgi:hypothetical protein